MSTPRNRIEARLGIDGPPMHSLRDDPPAIPDHELVRRIGQGSYGEVWLARNALGAWRAVKIVYRDTFKEARPYEREFAGIRRFEPLSRSNEGFVDILQVGRDDVGGWFYYVMELADAAGSESGRAGKGERETEGSAPAHLPAFSPATYQPRTLARDLHHRGRLLLEDCLQLGLTLTLAVGHLHRHGLIHRDVKPSNIIFVGGVPKLADIGLVTEAQGANTFVGTEGFVPPEGPTSPQADLYALGKVLYEAAMGKDRNEFPEPFTEIGADRESVVLMELNAVLLCACAPDPKKRYATAEEMHADLALLHSGGSVKRRHQFDRQFRLAKQAGAVAITAAFLIGGALLWQRQQTQKMTLLATEKSKLATEKTQLAENLARLDEENRNRIVRLDIANGTRLLDDGDPAGALLWFADALPLLKNNPAQEAIHRIRIQQTLNQTPRVLRVFPHESGVNHGVFSPDGRWVATTTRHGQLRMWNTADGAVAWGPKFMDGPAHFLRFSRDGKRLFLGTSPEQGLFNGGSSVGGYFAVLDARSGRDLWPAGRSGSGFSTNLVGSHFSPNDRWLATVERDQVIRVFELETQEPVVELRGHTDEVRFVSFSADGSLLASASLDRTVRLWRLPSGEPVGAPLEHAWPVVRVLLTDNGQRLISASFAKPGSAGFGEQSESEVQAWEVTTGQKLGDAIKTGGWMAMFVAPGETGRFVVTQTNGLMMHPFAPSGQSPVRLAMEGVHSWAFSRDGGRLALGGGELWAQVFDAQTGASLTERLGHRLPVVTSVQFSPDENALLTVNGDGNARLWDLRPRVNESALLKLPADIKPVFTRKVRRQLGRSPGGTAITLQDGTVRIIGEELQELERFAPESPNIVVQCPTSAWQANLWAIWSFEPGSSHPRWVSLWRKEGDEARRFDLAHSEPIFDHSFTQDDRYLITYSLDRRIRFWRTSDGQLERSLAVPEPEYGELWDFSPDGRTGLWRRVDLAPREGQARQLLSFRFLDLDTGNLIGEPLEGSGTLSGDCFWSPTGGQVAIMDTGGPIIVVESRTGRVISSSIAHSSNPSWVQWDLAGGRLLTAGHDDQVLVWDAATGAQLLGPLRTPGSIIRTARWSPDGRYIVTRNDARQVRVWDASTGEAVTPPLEQAGAVNFAYVTRQDRVIVASFPDLVTAWDLKPTPLPSDVVSDYAKLLSGSYLNAAGVVLTLKPEELAELDRSLHVRAPQLFQ